MPVKIRELKARLRKVGFYSRPGKGSHTIWKHPSLPGERLVFSGADGADAQRYQVDDVQDALDKLQDKLRKGREK